MKKKIKGKANPKFGDSVFVKADKAVAELEARGFTIVEVRGILQSLFLFFYFLH